MPENKPTLARIAGAHMPDVNALSIAELWEHANYYVGAVRTDDPNNLTHNAQMLANLVERLSEQVSHFRPASTS
jgi:hypothetical protein